MFTGMMSPESELLPLQYFVVDVQPWTSWLQPGDRIMVKNKIPRFVIGAVVIASISRYTSFPECPESFSSVQLLSHVWFFVKPWITAHQASLSITNSRSSLRLKSIELVMPSRHVILCCPFSSYPQSLSASESFPMSQHFTWGGPSIGISALGSVLPMNTQDWSLLEWTGWISLQSKGLSRIFSNTTVQKHQFFSTQLSSQSNSHIHTWPQEKP